MLSEPSGTDSVNVAEREIWVVCFVDVISARGRVLPSSDSIHVSSDPPRQSCNEMVSVSGVESVRRAIVGGVFEDGRKSPSAPACTQ